MELVESGMLSRMSCRLGMSMIELVRMESEMRSRMESEMRSLMIPGVSMVMGMVTWR